MSKQPQASKLKHDDVHVKSSSQESSQTHLHDKAEIEYLHQLEPLLLLEHLDSPDLYQALEDAFVHRQEAIVPPQKEELQSLVGTWWFDAEQDGFLLNYQCAQIFGFSDYHRRYSIEEISKTLTPQNAQKLFFVFFNPDAGDVLIENINLQVGPYKGEHLVVQGSILERYEKNGIVRQAIGAVCYAHAAPASYMTRELNGDGIFYINSAEDFILTSSSYHTMLGYIKGDFPHSFTQFVEQLVHPDDKDNLEIQRHVMEYPDYGNLWSCCLRLKHKNGHYIWTIGRGMVLRRNEKGVATVIVGSRSDINLVHQNFEHMHQLLFNDNLTGLYNRTYLEQNMLSYAEDSLQPVSVLFLDVTGLKITNDILGHNYGDFLLLKLSELLLYELLYFIRELRNPEQRAELRRRCQQYLKSVAKKQHTKAQSSTSAPAAAPSRTTGDAGDTATATAIPASLDAPDEAEKESKRILPAFVFNYNFEHCLLECISNLQYKIESMMQNIGLATKKQSSSPRNLASSGVVSQPDKAPDDKSLSEVLLMLPQNHHERISKLLEKNAALLENANMVQSDPLIWALVETALHGREHPSSNLSAAVNDYIHNTINSAALETPFAAAAAAAAEAGTRAAGAGAAGAGAEDTAQQQGAEEGSACTDHNVSVAMRKKDLWEMMSPLETSEVVSAVEQHRKSQPESIKRGVRLLKHRFWNYTLLT